MVIEKGTIMFSKVVGLKILFVYNFITKTYVIQFLQDNFQVWVSIDGEKQC